jgi:hypothetical protein
MEETVAEPSVAAMIEPRSSASSHDLLAAPEPW